MDVKPLSRPRCARKGSTRYSRHIPRERVQMDTCKIAPEGRVFSTWLHQAWNRGSCRLYVSDQVSLPLTGLPLAGRAESVFHTIV